jgi:adenosine deaminase
VTVNPRKVRSLEDYLSILHDWTERIQSSPRAIERSVYEIIGKEFRGSRVTQIELRFNP